MIHINDIKNMILYKKQLYLPFDLKDKLKGSAVILITPDLKSTVNTMKHPLLINKYHKGYYIEKDITYFINNEYMILGNVDDLNIIREEGAITCEFASIDDNQLKIDISKITKNDYQITDNVLTVNLGESSLMVVFNDSLELESIAEGSINYNSALRQILYDERFRTPKEVVIRYEEIKALNPDITRTFITYNKYQGYNLFVDFHYYNETYFKNTMYKLDKGVELYLEFLTRFINDRRLKENGYNMKNVIIPINDWADRISGDANFTMYTDDINPISIIYRLMKTDKLQMLKSKFKDTAIIFTGRNGYFKLDFAQYDDRLNGKFLQFVKLLANDGFVPEEETSDSESTTSIVTKIVDKIEAGTKVKINNLTGEGETTQDQIVAKVQNAAITSKTEDEAMETLNSDDDLKKLLIDIASTEDETVKITAARSKRMSQLQQDYQGIKVKNSTVKEILDNYEKRGTDIPKVKLDIDSPNEEWKEMSYINFEKHYSVEPDLLECANFFADKSAPVAIRAIDKEDTSTSEDYVVTYTFQMEDANGKRFSLKMDIPQFKDDMYMILKGNEKSIVKQLLLLPIVKTDADTVQIVSNYNKIFLSRFGNKSFVTADRLIKFLDKNDDKSIKVTKGDCTIVNSKHYLPIDYSDIATKFISIETKRYDIILNMDSMLKKYPEAAKHSDKEYPIAYDRYEKKVIFNDYDSMYSKKIIDLIIGDDVELRSKYNETSISKKYAYTRASILSFDIPLIVVLGYNEGLFPIMKKANIKFELHEKRPSGYDKDSYDIIKFNDAFILYELTYESSLLMNGIKECNTEDYSIKEVNGKAMWMDFLTIFATRLAADGLDNFYELMIDPITKEVLEDFNLPTTYTECMLYANELLADTGYTDHTDMTSRRLRSNELVAAFAYKTLCESYEQYKLDVKNRKKNPTMTIKQTAVIDKILTINTVSDHSSLNAVQEAEELNTVSYKGFSGMNSDRSFGMDKRGFSPTMINLLGLSTNVGPNAGVNRQATMDANIQGKRGYIKTTGNPESLSITKGFTVSEGITPFGTTRDDPPRSSMKFIQDKHGMRVKHSSPLLITNGTDEALPYMISNTFVFKSADKGEVIDMVEGKYMILKYANGKSDFVDLRSVTKKNSNGGFYTPIRLETKLKKGSKFQANEIIAVDPLSFSDKVGAKSTLAYNVGTFVKFAILQTDDGFEDSAIVSEWLSSAMTTEVVLNKDIVLGKNADIYKIVSEGQEIQEGEPLIIYQNSYDEKDVNSLLRNLVDDVESVTDLGRVPIKSKVTGSVESIKYYRTVELDELSPTLKKKFIESEKSARDLANVMKKYNVEYANRFIEPSYALKQDGRLKGVRDGVLIEFYTKYTDKMSIGDKITFFVALKGIIKDIFPDGKEPYTDFRPNEKIDAVLAIASVNARLICSIKVQMLINKILVELTRSCKEILGLKVSFEKPEV